VTEAHREKSTHFEFYFKEIKDDIYYIKNSLLLINR